MFPAREWSSGFGLLEAEVMETCSEQVEQRYVVVGTTFLARYIGFVRVRKYFDIDCCCAHLPSGSRIASCPMDTDLSRDLFARPEETIQQFLLAVRQIGLQSGINPRRVQAIAGKILDQFRAAIHGSDSLFGEGSTAYKRSGEGADLNLHEKNTAFDERDIDCWADDDGNRHAYWELVRTFAYPRACPGDIIQVDRCVLLGLPGGQIEHDVFVVREIMSRVMCGYPSSQVKPAYAEPTLLVKSARCEPFDPGDMAVIRRVPGEPALVHCNLSRARIVGREDELGAGLALRFGSSTPEEDGIDVWGRPRNGN